MHLQVCMGQGLLCNLAIKFKGCGEACISWLGGEPHAELSKVLIEGIERLTEPCPMYPPFRIPDLQTSRAKLNTTGPLKHNI